MKISPSGMTAATAIRPASTTAPAMKAVFLDTGGLIALWDTADQWHRSRYWRFSSSSSSRTLDHGDDASVICYECGNTAARRPYRSRVNVCDFALDPR